MPNTFQRPGQHQDPTSGEGRFEERFEFQLPVDDIASGDFGSGGDVGASSMHAVPPPLPPQRGASQAKLDAEPEPLLPVGAPVAAVASTEHTSGRLPRAYVATWAAMAIASSVYLGMTLSGAPSGTQGGSDQVAATSTEAGEPAAAARSAISPELSNRLAQKRESLAEVVAELSKPPVVAEKPPAPVADAGSSDPLIATRKVPTVRLTPSTPPGVAVLNAPKPFEAPVVQEPAASPPPATEPPPATQIAAPLPASAPVDTSAITTGSIPRLPPPPLRAPPPPPEFLRAQAEAAAAKLAALEKEKAEQAARAKPVVFGPATVNRADDADAAGPDPALATSRAPVLGAAIGVRLATAPSIDALRLQWTLISERYGAQLSGLSPRYVQASANGIGSSYELIAGPVPGTIEALEICQGIVRAGGARCIIGDFVGNAL